jgi:hypothetical protein
MQIEVLGTDYYPKLLALMSESCSAKQDVLL